MAVTAFDGNFSFRQEELARLGGHEPSQMTKEQWLEFQNSPFMQSMKKADELAFVKTIERDEKRKARDPEFDPQDSDWKAEKSFQFDKAVNYYKVMGIDELASLAEIKAAYKKLSLVFHPDKTAGMTSKEKEEYNAIFIEIKNAYKTLSDPPTRRQLDRDRDRDFAVQEVNGWKPKHKKAFDATDLLKKMQEESKAPGKTVDIPISVRLEKFFYGGQKGIKRERRIKDFTEYITEEKMYRLEVPRGAPHPLPIVFKDAGDHQDETRPDTLRFVVSSKPHAVTERRDDDLFVRQAIALRADAHMQPYLSGNLEVLRGYEVVFWGRNPFFRSTGSGAGELRVKLLGEGMGSKGSLNLTAKLGAGAGSEDKVVVRLKQIQTGAEMALRLPKEATMGDAMAKAGELLDFLGSQKVQIMKAAAGGHVPYEDSFPIGSLRSLECGGTQWSEVPISTESAASLLHALIGIHETDLFQTGLAAAYGLLESSLSEARTKVNELWQQVADVLPDFGFEATISKLEKVVEKALAELEGEEEFAFLCSRCKKIAVGFDPDAYEEQGSSVRKPVGLAGHPIMVDRTKARMSAEPVCEAELSPLFAEPVALSTKPACSVMLFSNAQQCANPPMGQVAPKLLFAASIASLPGSKKGQREEWTELRENLGPLLRDSLFCIVRAARGILPRPLSEKAAFADGDYTLDEDVVVTEPGGKTPWEELDGEQEDDDDEDGGGGGGGMFDFDDEDDEDGDKDDDDDDDAGGGGMFDFDDMDNAAEKKAAKAAKAEAKRREKAGKRATRVVLKREAAAEERRKAAAEKLEAKAGTNGVSHALPWAELGNRALRRGDCFLAASYYSRHLDEQLEGDVETAGMVLASRSVCLARVGHVEAAYDDAKAAVEKREQWGKAWSALAAAAALRGEDFAAEAQSAYFKAVQYDPIGASIEALLEAVRAAGERSEDKAREEKDKGNAAIEASDLGLAIAHYTNGVGLTPEEGESSAALRAALLSNRCLAFMKRREWDLAISDGKQAVAACGTHAMARLRLGTALLGVGKSEEAYSEFANGLKADPENEQLKKARSTCLSLMPLWRSVAAMTRVRTRFSMDASRPKGTSKVFAMSDLHFDHKRNDEWVSNIDEFQFQDDVLVIAGNVADTFVSLVRCLKALKSKFRRVFFTPGNHEFWIHPSESDRFPDSVAKFNAILAACDQLEVDVFPAAICEDCYICPLFSWYNAQYDEKDPFTEPKLKFDTHCVWPMEAEELWRFFLELNKAQIDLPFGDTVITFSHFLPRQGLPYDGNVPKVAKAMGCEELDEQIRDQYLQSKLHIYGHSRRKYASAQAGVMYIEHSLGYENEHSDVEPLMCVYNGQSICNRTVPIRSG